MATGYPNLLGPQNLSGPVNQGTYQPAPAQAGTMAGADTGYLVNQANANDPNSSPGAQFGQTQGGANAYANSLAGVGQSFLGQQAQNPNSTQFGGSLSSDYAQFQAAQAQQRGVLGQLQAQANGTAVNPASAQMAAGTQQAQNQQQAMAHSAGIGGAGAMAARNAQTTGATLGINNANATAQANAQFQAQGAQQYQQAANQYAQQQQAWQQGQQGYGAGYASLQQQQYNQNSQNQLGAYQQAQQVQEGQLTSDVNQAVAQEQRGTNAQAAANAANSQWNNQLTGAALQGTTSLIGMGAMSDARIKKDILRDTLADKFLEHLHPYSYRYQDPADDPGGPTGGRYMGVMAQDVEQAPEIGPQLVKNTPRGKALSVPATMSALAAGVGRLHERLKALEEGRARGGNPDGE
jgi:hypothetical protein